MKRVLMISPYFVPMNYVGAKRALHLARHLPALGWEPAVVALPASLEQDPALLPLVPDLPMYRGFRSGPVAWVEDGLARLRAPGHAASVAPKLRAPAPASGAPERGLRATLRHLGHELRGLLSDPVDRFTKYLPWAFAGAWRLLRRMDCRAIYANAGPFSALQLGAALARVSGLPLVSDLRDPWSLEPNYRAARTAGAQRLVELQEARCFARSAAVLLNTEAALQAYRAEYAGRLPPERFDVLRNCYDPALYAPGPPAPSADERFRIVYYGHLRATKNAALFLRALRRFVHAAKLPPERLVFTTLGERTAADREAIVELGLGPYVEERPWLPFTRCRELLGTAHLLVDLMGPQHELQISGKLYDYLACERRVLSVSPNTELDGVLGSTGAGKRVPVDEDAVFRGLQWAWQRRGQPLALDAAALATFQARPAAQRLAGWLDRLCVGPAGPRGRA